MDDGELYKPRGTAGAREAERYFLFRKLAQLRHETPEQKDVNEDALRGDLRNVGTGWQGWMRGDRVNKAAAIDVKLSHGCHDQQLGARLDIIAELEVERPVAPKRMLRAEEDL